MPTAVLKYESVKYSKLLNVITKFVVAVATVAHR